MQRALTQLLDLRAPCKRHILEGYTIRDTTDAGPMAGPLIIFYYVFFLPFLSAVVNHEATSGWGWRVAFCHSVILAFPSHCYHTHTKGIQDAPTGAQSFFFCYNALSSFNLPMQHVGVTVLVFFTSVTYRNTELLL